MSEQWETASHCNQALFLLSKKIQRIEKVPDTSKSFAYAMSTPDRDVGPIDPVEIRERQRTSYLSRSDSYANDMSNSLGSGYVGSTSQDQALNVTRGPPPTDNTTPSSLDFDFQNGNFNHPTGGSNFDLNMVDLLHGANFDSLFDMIGQQYPSF